MQELTNGQDADTAPGPVIPAGGEVTWMYVVTNTGNVRLTGALVRRDREVCVSCPNTCLLAGKTMVSSGAGVTIAGLCWNQATVKSPYGALTVSDTDDSHYTGTSRMIYLPLALR